MKYHELKAEGILDDIVQMHLGIRAKLVPPKMSKIEKHKALKDAIVWD